MNRQIANDIVKCCALCEYSMKMDIKGQYYCKYKNNISEVDPDERCRHFELDLLKLNPRPHRRVKLEL